MLRDPRGPYAQEALARIREMEKSAMSLQKAAEELAQKRYRALASAAEDILEHPLSYVRGEPVVPRQLMAQLALALYGEEHKTTQKYLAVFKPAPTADQL